jgi:DNA-binding transcriptional LysR family regulator
MELVQKYVYQVYVDKSFSIAARNLFISQPALSQAISRLEKELDIKIFQRGKIPISLTPQGEIYIEMLEEIMEAEARMQRSFRRLSDMTYGSITIGGSSYAAYCLMTGICGEFYKRFPKIKVTLDIGNVGKRDILKEKLQNGQIDLLITYTDSSNDPQFIPIMNERLIIAINKSFPINEELKKYVLTREEIITGTYTLDKEIKDLSVFKDIPFTAYENNSLTERRMSDMLGAYKTTPYSIKDARHSEMQYKLMCSGIGAVMTTDLLIMNNQRIQNDILYFVPASKESHRTVYLQRRLPISENPITDNFISIAKEVCKKGYKMFE